MPSTSRLATLDIGTNTSSLLVVETEGDALRRLHASEQFVRLGAGVDASGRIAEAAQERLLSTLREQVGTARSHGATRIVAAATSAMRDAANRQAVQERIRDALGLSVDLLSGEEEATWSFAAACAPFDDLRGDVLVIDIGGGSTELIAGRDPAGRRPRYAEAITARVSLDVGCVRLTERCWPSLPPPPEAVASATRIIDDALASATLSVPRGATLVGAAGTATALALVHAGPESTPEALTGDAAVLSRDAVRHWRDRLLDATVDDILALHPQAMPGRADVFPMGVQLLGQTMTHFGLDACRVSPYELRHGLALRALAAPPAAQP